MDLIDEAKDPLDNACAPAEEDGIMSCDSSCTVQVQVQVQEKRVWALEVRTQEIVILLLPYATPP